MKLSQKLIGTELPLPTQPASGTRGIIRETHYESWNRASIVRPQVPDWFQNKLDTTGMTAAQAQAYAARIWPFYLANNANKTKGDL